MTINENHNAKERYRQAKSKAKRVVATAKRNAYREKYKKLDTSEGEKIICRIAKARNKTGKDVGEIPIIKDQNGDILIKEDDVK